MDPTSLAVGAVGTLAFSKTGQNLMEVFGKALGWAFAARHEEALAEAKVVGETKGKIKSAKLINEFLAEQAMHRATLADIANQASPLIKEGADPQAVDIEWLRNFYDRSRLTSDTEMKFLWGKILANEVNAPGTFSKRTVNLVAQLEKSDAEDFTKVASFVLQGAEPTLFIRNWNDSIFRNAGITQQLLLRLQDAGLLNSESWGGYAVDFAKDYLPYQYFGKTFSVARTALPPRQPFVPSIFFLTTSGKQLFPVSGPTEAAGFLNYLLGGFDDKEKGWSASWSQP